VEKIAISLPVTHPLVRTYPDNDHESLYLGVHASHIAGKDEAAGGGKFSNFWILRCRSSSFRQYLAEG